MLIEKIKKDSKLKNYITDSCEDEGMSVGIADRITVEDAVVVKVDNYYNSLQLKDTPASPDCLIIIKCSNGGYALTIVELKGIESAKRFEVHNMVEKFQTCLDDFMAKRFKYLFIDYKRIRLYFVSEIEIYKRDLGLKLKVLQNKTFKYKNKKYHIEPRMPIPAVLPCY